MAKENRLVSCQTCGNKVSKKANSCPHCGEPEFRKKRKREVKEPSGFDTCRICDGKGFTMVKKPKLTFGAKEEKITCNNCNGEGKVKSYKTITKWEFAD